MPVSGRVRATVACAATVAVLAPLAWLWQDSRLPDRYPAMSMGYPDYGGGPTAVTGGPAGGHAAHAAAGRSLTTLVADPRRPADVALTLTARRQEFRLPSGRTVRGYTLNGASPGPVIRASVGQLVQVRLVNGNVPDGVTLHWHGLDVPNAMDGVAGVTQDAVRAGQSFTYRFVATQPGTYWYHSHQVSHAQVRGGLFGGVVIAPAKPAREVDVVALAHLYQGRATVNGMDGDLRVAASSGSRVRVRVINTDNGQMPVWVCGAPFRVAAVDGTEENGPAPLRDTTVPVTAGGRADLVVDMPADGSPVRVRLGGSVAVVLGSRSYDAPAVPRPAATLDLLSYGTPAPLRFDPSHPDRRFRYHIGREPGFLDGRPGMWWSVNGHRYPDVPMFVVARGDVVRMHIANSSGQAHPMHLHGHHAVVLARDGRPATGSPWWVDSLDVAEGQTYDIAFVADNPGVWMDHCHNLPHAAEGLVAHLMYLGITTPFMIGGAHGNEPE